MGKAARHRNKRKRRTTKQVMKHGRNAKRRHQRIGGRSGSIHHKKTKPASTR